MTKTPSSLRNLTFTNTECEKDVGAWESELCRTQTGMNLPIDKLGWKVLVSEQPDASSNHLMLNSDVQSTFDDNRNWLRIVRPPGWMDDEKVALSSSTEYKKLVEF